MFVIKEFQTTCLILLTDCAKDNVPYLLTTAANRSRIKCESEYNIVLSLTNIFLEGWDDISGYLYAEMVYQSSDSHPSKSCK